MKKQLIRFCAGLLASIVLVGCVAYMGNMPNGKRTDGIFYEASGIHPDAALLMVNNRAVSAEEFLYWLAYDCDYLTARIGTVDFNQKVGDTMTYGQYAMNDAESAVVLYEVVRQWAEAAGVTLTDEDQAALNQQREQYVQYYGGEEGYAQQLALMGISEECFQRINETYFLYSRLSASYCSDGGALRPSDEEVAAFASQNAYYTVQPLYWTISGDESADAASRAQAEDFAQQLKNAGDKESKYQELAALLAIETSEGGQTFSGSTLGEELTAAIAALGEGEVSDVVETDGGYYVFLRKPVDASALLTAMFDSEVAQRRESAAVKYSSRYYSKLSVADFYSKLTEQRSAMSSTDASGDANNAG